MMRESLPSSKSATPFRTAPLVWLRCPDPNALIGRVLQSPDAITLAPERKCYPYGPRRQETWRLTGMTLHFRQSGARAVSARLVE